jgi:hypothetical protein
MALPFGTTGSLCPTFVPDRLVGLTVKHPYAITLYVTVTNRLEGTFGSLRYAFGGDHPSQTTHHSTVSQYRVRNPSKQRAVFQG